MSRSRKGSRKSGAVRSVPSRNGRTGQSLVTATNTEVAVVAGADDAAITPTVKRRRFSRRRILLGILAAVLVLALGGVGWFYFTVQRGLPTLSGNVQFKGLSAPVTITRDEYGVPHITAANIADLYAAQGYVHAQDRLTQMFFFRAYGQGRQAELAGEDAVDLDRFLRIAGFKRAAEAELAQMAPEVRAGLEAYARGVNEFIRTHRDSMPLEFTLGGFGKMEDWQPVDSVTFSKLQAWDLSGSWGDDILASNLTAALGVTRTAQLLPNYPAGGPFIVPNQNSGGLSPLLRLYTDRLQPAMQGIGLKGQGPTTGWSPGRNQPPASPC